MKILFIAPRFHTNQFYSTKALIEDGNKVEFLVTYFGKSEDYTYLKPKLLKRSLISYFVNIIVLLFFKKNNKQNILNFLFVPSFLHTLRYIKINKFDVIICRDRNFTTLVINFIYFVLGSKGKIFLYNQTAYESELKGLRKTISYLFPLNRITPIFNDSDYNNKDQTFFIPFLVNTDERSDVYFHKNRINILTIGKFQENKNFIFIIDSIKDFLNKRICHLTIVGEVSNKHHQTYYKFVSNYLLKNNIRNVDLKINVPYKDVSNFYSQNDIFILASKRELASISILEALSNGLLVISTKYNGSNCYLDKNFSFIFDVKNYNSLQPIFKELTKDRSKLKYLALSGKNRFLKNYSNNVFLSSFYKTTSKYVILKG
jgi:hypothetical protein